FDFVQCDEKTVKTVVRSNPGIVLLQQGTVRGQWSCGDTPDLEEAKAKLP
ncbi:MAG: DoxX family protein, partial [Flavobacteriales bacterium]|nr:DoxX family protein [Flavobacteriales bacterium]